MRRYETALIANFGAKLLIFERKFMHHAIKLTKV